MAGRAAGDVAWSYMQAQADRLKGSGAIRTEPVERAFRRVPRHLFAPPSFYTGLDGAYSKVDFDPDNPDPKHLEIIYSGRVLTTHLRDGLPTSAASDTPLVADMLELLRLDAGMRVLEIGAGTGYNAALLAEIAGDPALVTTVDNQPEVVREARTALTRAGYPAVRVVEADGYCGAPETAPFDRVIVTVGCPDLSPHWVDQLVPGGLILLPLRHAGANPLLLVGQHDGEVSGRFVGLSGFMAIQGELYDDAYYAPSGATDQGAAQVFPLWPDLRDVQSPWDRQPFWFYVGLKDPRACITSWAPPTFALVDTTSGSSLRIEGKQIILNGDQALLDTLETLHEEWLRLGSPNITDYTVRFVPTGEPVTGSPPEDPWVVTDRYHTRVYQLAPH